MVMDRSAQRGHVYLVSLDPTEGSEIRKTRPCVVVSPDDMPKPDEISETDWKNTPIKVKEYIIKLQG